MSNHDVPRNASRYALPQVASPNYHQLAKDWLLRDGTSYVEDRELGTRRARAAILMEAGLPGSLYVYQGEELGLFEVPDIAWDRLEDPTPFFTRRNFTEKGRDGCRVPLPWDSTDEPAPASWDASFGEGRSFGFSPATRPDDASPSADPHLPQPLWYKNFAVNEEERNPDSMLGLYRMALEIRATQLTATADTSCQMLDSENDVIAYTRPAVGGHRFVSTINFGPDDIEVPQGQILASSIPLVNGKLPQDATVWVLLDE
jgi:alpha-glucosidase